MMVVLNNNRCPPFRFVDLDKQQLVWNQVGIGVDRYEGYGYAGLTTAASPRRKSLCYAAAVNRYLQSLVRMNVVAVAGFRVVCCRLISSSPLCKLQAVLGEVRTVAAVRWDELDRT